jgi:hypothetical protein
MNKTQLCQAFLNNVNGDAFLMKGELFHFVTTNADSEKKIPKPLDDLIDAYFLSALLASKA